ncbi:MAG: hypothetical protein AAFO79_08345 [Pseudomonadota bacterium]
MLAALCAAALGIWLTEDAPRGPFGQTQWIKAAVPTAQMNRSDAVPRQAIVVFAPAVGTLNAPADLKRRRLLANLQQRLNKAAVAWRIVDPVRLGSGGIALRAPLPQRAITLIASSDSAERGRVVLSDTRRHPERAASKILDASLTKLLRTLTEQTVPPQTKDL